MLKKLLVAAAIAGLTSSAAMADRMVTFTWTGKVTSGTDDFNVFGGGDMSGADFTSSFVFNFTKAQYTLGTMTQGDFVYPFFSDYYGGPVSASFKIGATTVSFDADIYSLASARSDPSQIFGPENQSEVESDAESFAGNTVFALFNRISLSGADRSWADLGIGDFDGDVSEAESDPNSNFFAVGDYSTFQFEQLYLANQHLTISNAEVAGSSPTPEPASWALMLGGFGLVGGAMRSRRAKAAVSFG